MIKKNDLVMMRAVALCYKPFLKPEEALIYTNLARTQFAKKCGEYGVYKTDSGYYKKEELDRMMAGERSSNTQAAKNLKVKKAS